MKTPLFAFALSLLSTSLQAKDVEIKLGGKCLDLKANDRANGTPIQLYDCNGTTAQRFTIEEVADTPKPSDDPPPINHGEKEIAVYFQSWSAPWASRGSDHSLAKLPPYVTTVLLAFVRPEAAYSPGSSLYSVGLDFSSDPGVIKEAVAIAKSQGKTVLLSVGGATYVNWSSYNVDGVISLMNYLGADGIDLDYEDLNQVCGWSTGGTGCPKDQEFISIIRKTKAKLPAGKLLTTAAWSTGAYGEGDYHASKMDGRQIGSNFGLYRNPLKEVGSLFDRVYIMAYDAGNKSSTGYDYRTAYEAYRSLYKGRLIVGVESCPEAWGGNCSDQADAKARASLSSGVMLWSWQKAGGLALAQAACQQLGMAGCEAASPISNLANSPVFYAASPSSKTVSMEIPEINQVSGLTPDGTAFLAPGFYSPEVTDRSIIYVAGGRWPYPNRIDVCWVNPEEGGEIVGDLQGWLSNEYKKANIGFNFQGKCTAYNTPNQIRAYFKRTHSWNTNGGISGGGGLSYIGPVNGQLGGVEGPGTLNIQVAKDRVGYAQGNWRQWTINVTRATATHEFGHALGLAHEQERNDAPACGDQRGTLPNSGAYKFVGAYDAKSIMNYCKDPANVSSLSDGDIAGIKELYPPAATSGQPKGSYEIKNMFSGACLDINANGMANGSKVQNWGCNGSTAQSFWIVNSGEAGWVYLKHTNSDKCLDVPSSSTANGTKIQLYSCNGTGAQLWAFDPRENGYARIRNRTSGKCVDLSDWNKGDGTPLQQWDCGEGANQKWGFFRK